MCKKMYVLVRSDLDPIYRCVQGSHALAQFSKEYPEKYNEWNNSTLVFLGVRYAREIQQWSDRLSRKEHSVYREPDQDGQPTALAFFGNGYDLKDLQLA